MLRPRIIPCLLVHKMGLVKTTQFSNPKYVGDPINAVKIFNEKEVDELVVFDIDASAESRGPDFNLIKNLANECRMPLCYGGGISNVEQAVKIINLGAEKVALNTAAIKNFEILKEIGNIIGMQSVVVVIDVKFDLDNSYAVYIKNGKEKVNINFIDYLEKLNAINVGEIIINNIDNDGMMQGYDLSLSTLVRNETDLPLTILGGAGSYSHLQEVISKFKIIGVAAGSLFVFKGKFKAVLISYPKKDEKNSILNGTI